MLHFSTLMSRTLVTKPTILYYLVPQQVQDLIRTKNYLILREGQRKTAAAARESGHHAGVFFSKGAKRVYVLLSQKLEGGVMCYYGNLPLTGPKRQIIQISASAVTLKDGNSSCKTCTDRSLNILQLLTFSTVTCEITEQGEDVTATLDSGQVHNVTYYHKHTDFFFYFGPYSELASSDVISIFTKLTFLILRLGLHSFCQFCGVYCNSCKYHIKHCKFVLTEQKVFILLLFASL